MLSQEEKFIYLIFNKSNTLNRSECIANGAKYHIFYHQKMKRGDLMNVPMKYYDNIQQHFIIGVHKEQNSYKFYKIYSSNNFMLSSVVYSISIDVAKQNKHLHYIELREKIHSEIEKRKESQK